jgi:emfourin
VRIRVERSGGFAGISLTKEIDERDLPPSLISTAKKIILDKNQFSLPTQPSPRGAADHYFYKISIEDGGNQTVINCDQYNIKNDLKFLVKYIEGHVDQR